MSDDERLETASDGTEPIVESTRDTSAEPSDRATITSDPTPSVTPANVTPASRARRIGSGRPLPGPGRVAGTAATTETATTAATEVATDTPEERPARATAPKPGTTSARKRARTSTGAADAGTDTDTDTDNDTPTKDVRPPKRRDAEATLRRLRWVPAGVLGLAVIVLAVLCVVLGHGVWWAKKSVSTERDQVLAAAKTCVGSITNYDYRKLAASEQAGLACTTGTFQAQYKQAMDTVVAKLAPQTKTVQTFQVADAGVESVSSNGDQWVVLVYGQQAVTNAQTGPSSPRLDILSAQVTLNKVGGQWRVSELKRL